jgi:hypothetical protein
MTIKSPATGRTAEAELRSFIEKFDPKDQRLIRSVRSAVRKRFPTLNELVWDNYNFFVIGYSPTERPSDSILSIAARANGVGLCFIRGARLDDPKKLLQGSGRQTRFIRIQSPSQLADPDVEALIAAAIGQATTPPPSKGRGSLIIRSVAAKQRPRQRAGNLTLAGAAKGLSVPGGSQPAHKRHAADGPTRRR